MGHTYAVLGAGMQGTAAAYDLVRHGGAGRVRLLDCDPARLEGAAARLRSLLVDGPVEARVADVRDPAGLQSALAGVQGVLAALPYGLNPQAARAAVSAGACFCDLGGHTGTVRRELALDDTARVRGVSVVPDCGVAPGLANVLAADGLRRVPGARHVRIFCGGLPQKPLPPLDYRLLFDPAGLTNEYRGEAEVLRNGRVLRLPALSEAERVHIPPLGELEAFLTSGGSSTAPESHAGRLETYEYKTLRRPGHLEKVRLLSDLGMLEDAPVEVGGTPVSLRNVLHALLRTRCHRPEVPDLLVLRVVVTRRPRKEGVCFDLYDLQDTHTGFTAMERCTAFSAAATLHLQVLGRVPGGAATPERCVPPEALLEAVRARGLAVRMENLEAGEGGSV